jgi:soluble P-type ATPase
MKKILATVSAVVLSLAMVAMPSVAATAVPPDDVGQDTCDKLGYNKPAALDASSGNVDIYDGLVLIGNLTWSGASVSYDLEPGWTIDICIKSGAQTGGGDKITEFSDLVGSGATPAIEQNISHIGYTATFTRTELITVTPDATFVDESCDVESEVLTKGVITVDLSVVGVTYTITQGGNPVAFDAVTGKTGPLTAGLTYIVTASANTGYKLSGPYEEQFTPTDDSEDCDEDELITVTPDATFVDESCDVESEVLTKGVITVDLSVVGVTYTITQGGNPVAFDAVTGKTGPLTAGLTYIVTASANTGHKLSGPYEEQFTPFSAAIDCETLPGVTPFASQDPGCELPSFFTIGNTLADPTALSWTANGNPIAEGKHVVNGATTITVAATANPGYGIEGDPQTEWTFTFPAKETCDDLDTLALTGASDTTPALALTAFLGLLGLAMVRSGIRVNRIRQEA